MIGVSHYLGAPSIQLWINIANESSKPLKIKNISIKISKLGASSIELNAYGLYEKPESTIQKIFAPFAIKSDGEWSSNIFFYSPFEGEDEQKLKEIIYNLKRNLEIKRVEMNSPYPVAPEKISADQCVVDTALELYKKNKYWVSGDYFVSLEIMTDTVKTSVQKKFLFLLNDFEVKELDSITERYKHGATLTYIDNNATVFPYLRVPS